MKQKEILYWIVGIVGAILLYKWLTKEKNVEVGVGADLDFELENVEQEDGADDTEDLTNTDTTYINNYYTNPPPTTTNPPTTTTAIDLTGTGSRVAVNRNPLNTGLKSVGRTLSGLIGIGGGTQKADLSHCKRICWNCDGYVTNGFCNGNLVKGCCKRGVSGTYNF